MDNDYFELIKKAQAGSAAALVELIKKEQNNIYATLFYLNKNSQDTLDIAQNVLLKMSGNISQLKNPINFKTWLNQIILHCYYDYLRKNKKKFPEMSLSDLSEEKKFEIPDRASNPENSALYSELDLIIKTSIENLPLHYKIPIALREIQGLSYDDISKITNTAIGTVKSRIARARGMIKDRVRKYTRG